MRVAESDSYPGQLEAFLNRAVEGRFQVQNRGRPGQNTALILSTLRDDLAADEPDVLLVMAGLNNGWNVAGRGSQSIFDSLRIVRLLRIALHDRAVEERRDDGATEAAAVTRSTSATTDEELREMTRKDLVQIAEIAAAAQVRCVLQTYPSHHPHMEPYNQAARDAAAATGALLSDHDARFGRYIDQFGWDALFFEDSHPVEAGYALMARDLLSDLVADGAVDAEPLPTGWAPTGFRKAVSLQLERDASGRPSALLLDAEPGDGFQVYLSPLRVPEVDLGTRRIPIGQHQWVESSKTQPGFRGETDRSGHARVPLPEEVSALPEGAVLYAAFVTKDPRATHELSVRAISNVVLIRGGSASDPIGSGPGGTGKGGE